jgi:hypothetical protein
MRGGAPLGRSLTGQVTVGSPRSDGGDQAVSDELLRKEPYRDERPLTMVSFPRLVIQSLQSGLLLHNMRVSPWNCSTSILISSRFIHILPVMGMEIKRFEV